MFSISAINESDSGGQWEPLAPTKEAQEFHLSQKYHEGLLKFQSKDYSKARELLEDVLKDPLISKTQVENIGSDHHLQQLRFLALKNLAAVFLEQGSKYYDKALHCYLQAVELDESDSVVWNQLGTLSCLMGLLSTSRWAFEQGLLCSPNNWNCMEKLLEVLIAIGDEVACLSVANLILRHWPSHSRALHVKKTIEDAEPVPFAPCGIDTLEPRHARLKFPNKRKSIDDETDKKSKSKKSRQSIELQLSGAKWSAILDGILGFLNKRNEKACDGDDKDIDRSCLNGHGTAKSLTYSRIDIQLPMCPYETMDNVEGQTTCMSLDAETESAPAQVCKTTVKEKDSNSDKEYPHERRSSRLERLRSRKNGKDESESSGKDIGSAVAQFLDSFILRGQSTKDTVSSTENADNSTHLNVVNYLSSQEADDVKQFVSKLSKNCGSYHVGHLLLEEVAHANISFQDYFVKLMELEKLTRFWGEDRSPLCSLFLAELYYDQALCCADSSRCSELFSHSSYHLCKVVEAVALDSQFDFSNNFDGFGTLESKGSKAAELHPSVTVEQKTADSYDDPQNRTMSMTYDVQCDEPADHSSALSNNNSFWVRFYWLSGCLSLSSVCKKKAYNEFHLSLSLLSNDKKSGDRYSIILPHCKLVRLLTADRVRREINLIKLDSLLWDNDENIKNVTHAEFMKLLPPLLLSTQNLYFDNVSSPPKENERVVSLELSALDVLITACEKAKPMNMQVYLESHRRKLQILTAVAGIVCSVSAQKDKGVSTAIGFVSDLDLGEPVNRNWIEMVVEAVKDMSRNASEVKNFFDHIGPSDGQESLSSLFCIIADIQSLLLTIMCGAVKMIIARKLSNSGTSNQADQLESWCLLDSAIAFCKLQHLDPTASIKTQVELIVAVHDLLAEYGVCCAGRVSQGEEGTFLKFAIKHLLALDVKLKSLLNTNGAEGGGGSQNGAAEDSVPDEPSACDDQTKSEDELETEMEEVQSSLDSALDQAFFCLYGLKINPDSCSEEDPVVHKNTSRGDYQTKEQCADVFQYSLPYARALSRTGLVKLRRVLRAIRKHFPQPPYDVLANNAIDNFLDGPDSCEMKLWEINETNGSRESILNVLFRGEGGYEAFKKISTASSEPFLEVYGNLYYFTAQAEEISATDKYPGFVLTKEGEEFVEQSTNLFKHDLLYNPLRFESWQKLANLYDEEVDLLLNDGSKHMNILDWKENTRLRQRVEMGRRRSRRCLLVSLVLASTSTQQSQIHELLALVYYDSLQNVVPLYDQRCTTPSKDFNWMSFCQSSTKHFEKAFALKPDWLYVFYLGKLCEKLGDSPSKAFAYYSKAIALNPTAVDPVYRMHASRMKFLYTQGKENFDALQTVATHAFNKSTNETVLSMFESTCDHATPDINDTRASHDAKENKCIDPALLTKAWFILYDDCLAALQTCVEGELKHFHKARYKLAQGLYRRGEAGDLVRAKDELSFCFKSSRSSFTINMWEIDGITRKGRRKSPNVSSSRKNLEVSLSESSRKFITCIRKYMLLYLNLLEKNGDLWTLERAYTYLRTDRRFALCLGDIVPIGLGKYLQVLTSLIRNPETRQASSDNALEQLLEKMFNVFMDHAHYWTGFSSLPEVNSRELSESNLYGYIHQYIHLLESDVRLDALEVLNEKIRKKFKNPKLSSSDYSKIWKHASLAWCRSILMKLASITPLPDSGDQNEQPAPLSNSLMLYVDLQPDELLISSPEGPAQVKGLDMNWFETLNRIKNVQIKLTSEENMEAAVALMKGTFNFYRESSCGTFPSGINLYTVLSSQVPAGGQQPVQDVADVLDLSIPRKLLLWAYTLVHGRYSNISAVVKYCEEMKSRTKKGVPTVSTPSQPTAPSTISPAVVDKVKTDHGESSGTEAIQPSSGTEAIRPASVASRQEEIAHGPSTGTVITEPPKAAATSMQLTCSSSSKSMENVQ